MTPREPDRFDAKARARIAYDAMQSVCTLSAKCAILETAIKEAEASALERAAQVAYGFGACNSGDAIRALASPAAAPAKYDKWAATRGIAAPPAPLLPRVLAALENWEASLFRFSALAAELRAYIAEREPAEKRIAELERLANDNAFSGMQHKAHADAAEKRVAELEARR